MIRNRTVGMAVASSAMENQCCFQLMSSVTATAIDSLCIYEPNFFNSVSQLKCNRIWVDLLWNNWRCLSAWAGIICSNNLTWKIKTAMKRLQGVFSATFFARIHSERETKCAAWTSISHHATVSGYCAILQRHRHHGGLFSTFFIAHVRLQQCVGCTHSSQDIMELWMSGVEIT